MRDRLGGVEGNEILTSAVAVVLTALLLAVGVTVVRMRGLVGVHLFLGLALIPPVALKLASTGYRFARYYTHGPAYRAKGPPPAPLRMLAPVLVLATLGVFVTGVVLLADGHKAGAMLELHKISFIVWGVVFGVHFLAHLPRVVRSLRRDWTPGGRREVPGAGLRATLVALSLGAGAGLALALAHTVDAWRP